MSASKTTRRYGKRPAACSASRFFCPIWPTRRNPARGERVGGGGELLRPSKRHPWLDRRTLHFCFRYVKYEIKTATGRRQSGESRRVRAAMLRNPVNRGSAWVRLFCRAVAASEQPASPTETVSASVLSRPRLADRRAPQPIRRSLEPRCGADQFTNR